METSIVNSVTVSFGDDNIILPLGAPGSSCWRYSEEDNEGQTREKQSKTDSNIYGTNNVEVKTEISENIEDTGRPTEKSNSSASVSKDPISNTFEKLPVPVPGIGNVLRIKDKSKAEREYAANAVKKVNDLLRNSELCNESDFPNDQTDEDNPLTQEQVQEGDSGYIINPAVNQFSQEESQVHYFPSSSSSAQHVDTSSGIPSSLSSSSVSGVGSSSAAFTSNQYQPIQHQESEQVIKLIHTSDATLPYMCSACNMHSSNLGVMKQHIADHKKGVIKCPLLGLSKNVFICPFGNCDFNSPNYARVLTHLNRFHGSVAQHLIKQITSASLPEAVEALNDPISPLCQRESIWKEVALHKKPKVQSKLYACSECNFKDYDYKTVIVHLQGHVNQNKKQKTG